MSKERKIKTFLETSHRVLEVTMGDGRSNFYPQMKILFTVWRPIIDPEWAKPRPFKFNTLDAANTFLRDRQMKIKGTKIVKVKAHPFNLVFEKLKQTNKQ